MTYFSSQNIGQPVAFSDLKLTHTAAIFVPLPPGRASGFCWFYKVEFAVELLL